MTPQLLPASRLQKGLAFLSLYLVWGSTYLAIVFAIETLPPFLMAAVRHLTAGVLLYAWVHFRRGSRPRARQWLPATVVGGLLLMGGNGLVVWAEQVVPSGLAALLVASMPLWMVTLDSLRRGGTRPTREVALGLGLGFLGVGILIGPGQLGGDAVHPLGALALIAATLCWATGSLYSRGADLPKDPLLATAMEMLAGGVLTLILALAVGEGSRLDLAQVSTRSLLALGYLILFGSLLGFTAYIWLLRVAPPAQVSTYAYVNPLVAVFLGWLLADEVVGPRTLVAAVVIVGAVVMITRRVVPKGPVPVATVVAVGADAASGRSVVEEAAAEEDEAKVRGVRRWRRRARRVA